MPCTATEREETGTGISEPPQIARADGPRAVGRAGGGCSGGGFMDQNVKLVDLHLRALESLLGGGERRGSDRIHVGREPGARADAVDPGGDVAMKRAEVGGFWLLSQFFGLF